MQVASVTTSEARLTIEAAIGLLNGLGSVGAASGDTGSAPTFDIREHLAGRAFTRAARASAASIARIGVRVDELRDLFESLPDAEIDEAIASVNEQLTELPIAPSVASHDGVGPHLHWTASTATFDDQVVADILMALAIELCDDGTARFGRCAATDCGRLFYDGTRNRSRRFCDDRRCASRTHTADHRARRRAG